MPFARIPPCWKTVHCDERRHRIWVWPGGMIEVRSGHIQVVPQADPADIPAPDWSRNGKVVSPLGRSNPPSGTSRQRPRFRE